MKVLKPPQREEVSNRKKPGPQNVESLDQTIPEAIPSSGLIFLGSVNLSDT